MERRPNIQLWRTPPSCECSCNEGPLAQLRVLDSFSSNSRWEQGAATVIFGVPLWPRFAHCLKWNWGIRLWRGSLYHFILRYPCICSDRSYSANCCYRIAFNWRQKHHHQCTYFYSLFYCVEVSFEVTLSFCFKEKKNRKVVCMSVLVVGSGFAGAWTHFSNATNYLLKATPWWQKRGACVGIICKSSACTCPLYLGNACECGRMLVCLCVYHELALGTVASFEASVTWNMPCWISWHLSVTLRCTYFRPTM